MPRGGARKGAGRPRKRNGAKADAKTRSLNAAIRAAKGLTLRLLDELDAITTHHGALEDLIEAATRADDDGGRKRDAMLKAIGLPSRAAVLKQLLAATRAWNELERPAAKPGAPKGASAAPGGKKAQAAAAAETAGEGTAWGSDLDPTATMN